MAKTIGIKTTVAPLFSGHLSTDPQFKPLKLTPTLIKNLGLTELEIELKKHGILLSDALTTRMDEKGMVRFASPGVWHGENGYYLLFGLGRANGDYKFPLPDTTRLFRDMQTGRFNVKIAGVMIQVSTGLTWEEEDGMEDLVSITDIPKRTLSQSGSGGFAKSLAKVCLALDEVGELSDIMQVDLTCQSEPVLGSGKYGKYEITGSATVVTNASGTHQIPTQKLEITRTVALKLMQLWDGDAEVTITLVPATTMDGKPYLRVA